MLRLGQRGGRRMTAATMIYRCKKLHRAENISSCSYSTFCTYTATTNHATTMSRIVRCKEMTDLAWRLQRRRPGSRTLWSVGASSLANLPGKSTHHNNSQHLSMRGDINCKQQPPWCPTPGIAADNSHPECWQIVVCGGARIGAPWWP